MTIVLQATCSEQSMQNETAPIATTVATNLLIISQEPVTRCSTSSFPHVVDVAVHNWPITQAQIVM